MNWFHRNLTRFAFYRNLVDYTKTISLPFLGTFSLFHLLSEFFIEIRKGNIYIKSSALAFQFLLAIFPGLIFLFTLIAFIPIPYFQQNVLGIFQGILPVNVFDVIRETLQEVIIKKNRGLLSFGFFAAIYFSTSGMSTLIQSFYKDSNKPDSRTYFAKRLLALFLTISLATLLLIASTFAFASQFILHFFWSRHYIKTNLERFTLGFFQVFIITFLFYVAIALLYYFAPRRKIKKSFFSFGAGLAALASLGTTEGFAFYVSHFGTYNKIYGSLGTLLVLMVLLYLNSSILLLGYDLELSVKTCQLNFENRKNKKLSKI